MEMTTNETPVEELVVEKRTNVFWEKILGLFGAGRRKLEIRELEELPEFAVTVEPVMQQLTDELLRETIGPNGSLTKEFYSLMAGYNPSKNPIGHDDARKIIMSLLDSVVSKRKLLNERLERSVEVGDLYRNYYGRVHAVTSLAAQAHTDLERMDLAEEDFRYHYGVLMNVRDKSLLADVHPKNKLMEKVLDLRMKMNTREKDIMLELDERGGD